LAFLAATGANTSKAGLDVEARTTLRAKALGVPTFFLEALVEFLHSKLKIIAHDWVPTILI